VSVQKLVQGVEDKPWVVRELVVPASRGLQWQDWSSTSPHLEHQIERFSTITSKTVNRIYEEYKQIFMYYDLSCGPYVCKQLQLCPHSENNQSTPHPRPSIFSHPETDATHLVDHHIMQCVHPYIIRIGA
jgi:hypothetical protein